MEGAKKVNKVVDEILKKNNENQRNFLQKFSQVRSVEEIQCEEEQEVNLGLSLGGVYGENSKDKSLTRSSTVVGLIMSQVGGESDKTPQLLKRSTSLVPLTRSTSLPAETEPMTIKLNDFQAIRKMEAKKRLIERQKMMYRSAIEDHHKSKTQPPLSSQVLPWGTNPQSGGQGNTSVENSLSSKRDMANPIASATANGKIINLTKGILLESPSKKVRVVDTNYTDVGIEMMKKWPSVTTTGDDGRKIKGFLYKYTKTQVSIVCVCHGNFLTPAEFVEHAGGKDVDNPMRRITVCSSGFRF